MEPTKCYILSLILLIAIVQALSVDLQSDKMQLDFNSSTLPNHGLCPSMDIRNWPQNLAKLRNCSVIVGFLQIVLIEQNFSSTVYVFPELREITQYLVLYRVKHMKSIGDMFPNLTLIRGISLMLNYALVVFEMPNLQEIGLKSLKIIQRGAVRVDSNPQLCFTNTIDWKQITGSTKGNHFSENGNYLCPSFDACRGCDGYCWSSKFCQKFPSDKCHPECLGGCNQKGLCFRCANYSDNGFCVKQCPTNKFIIPESNECVTKKECMKLYGGLGWIFEDKCILSCPTGYNFLKINGTKNCILCDDTCNRTCNGALITGLQEAEYLKGCHYINGSLNIKIFDEISNAIDITEELERSLGNITEIKGYLRVYRSTAITSLNFFKNLKVIHGDELYNERYSFVVFEMSNLQVLFDWDTKKNFTIEKGTIFFNENVKLCLKEIRKFAEITAVKYEEHDVCPTSNGFKQFCSRTKMIIENVTVEKNSAIISWKRVKRSMTDIDKSGEALGYLIHYMQHDGENITTHHGIDSCSQVGWKVKFIPEPQESVSVSKLIVYNLTDLISFTKYAFYIQTYNEIRDQNNSIYSEEGESDVQYFKTKVNRPPMPKYFEAFSETENSLTLLWTMPSRYAEIVVLYSVEMYIIVDESKTFDKTNYCKQKIKRNSVSAYSNFRENDEGSDGGENCRCRDEEWYAKMAEINERYMKKDEIDCDDTEDDSEYGNLETLRKNFECGRLNDVLEPNHDRFPRNALEQFDIHEMLNLEPNPEKPVVENVTYENKYYTFSTHFSAENNNYTITDLKHFGKYVVYLAACIKQDGVHCGMAAITSQRTLKDPSADNIEKLSIDIYSPSVVAVKWKEPENPNGVVLSYTLQYKRADSKAVLNICITRLEHEENHGKYLLWNLSPGKYSVRVKTSSFGNEGEYTEWTDFFLSERVSTVVVLCFLSIGLIVAYGVVYLIRSKNRANDDEIDPLVTSETYLSTSVRYETQMGDEEVEFQNSY